MPKKHASSFQSTKPQPPPHPSLVTTSKPSSSSRSPPTTVNTILHHLRHSQSKASAPAVEPPPICPLLVGRRRGGNRTAGPPPPRSWVFADPGLQGSRHAPRPQQQQYGLDSSSFATKSHETYAPLIPGLQNPTSNSSLQAMVLRKMARNLFWHVEMEAEWLDVLPGRLKSALLAYVDELGQNGGLEERDLRALLGPVRDEIDGRWSSGGVEVTHLAIGSSIGRGVSWKALGGFLDRGAQKTSFSLEDGEEIPESWEEETATKDASVPQAAVTEGTSVSQNTVVKDVSADGYRRTNPPPLEAPKLPFLPDLTHLSLVRCSFPSWNSLLSPNVLSHLGQLTHLDISFWPVPTLTPNSMFAKVDSPMGPISYGGTNLYSAMDGDWREACSVLRRLGRGCRSLVWLGLEGCSDWWEALAYENRHGQREIRSRHWREDAQTPRNEKDEVKVRAMDWNGAWRGLSAINVGHAWAPQQNGSGLISRVLEEPSIHQVRRWAKSEMLIRNVEKKVREWRLQAGLKPVRFEKAPIPDIVARELQSEDLSRYM